jgi:hypothetical protein
MKQHMGTKAPDPMRRQSKHPILVTDQTKSSETSTPLLGAPHPPSDHLASHLNYHIFSLSALATSCTSFCSGSGKRILHYCIRDITWKISTLGDLTTFSIAILFLAFHKAQHTTPKPYKRNLFLSPELLTPHHPSTKSSTEVGA